MALKRISDFAGAGTLDGTEMVELETTGGSSVKTTTQDIANLATGGGGSSTALVGINDQTGTTYTLVLADAGKDVRCTNASAITLTVPPNSSVAFPVGTWLLFSQGGAGIVTAAAGAGVTLNAAFGVDTSAQYDVRGLEKTDTDTWRVV